MFLQVFNSLLSMHIGILQKLHFFVLIDGKLKNKNEIRFQWMPQLNEMQRPIFNCCVYKILQLPRLTTGG